jgi:hypothetical protein
VFPRNQVYARVTGWVSFEPWLSRIEEFEAGRLWTIAEEVPPEWYGGDLGTIERLMEQLLVRRGRVRELIESFRDSDREPFPNWGAAKSVVVPRRFAVAGAAGNLVM